MTSRWMTNREQEVCGTIKSSDHETLKSRWSALKSNWKLILELEDWARAKH